MRQQSCPEEQIRRGNALLTQIVALHSPNPSSIQVPPVPHCPRSPWTVKRGRGQDQLTVSPLTVTGLVASEIRLPTFSTWLRWPPVMSPSM